LSLTPGSINASCGIADGSAFVTVSGGTGSYTYLWDDSLTQTTDTATGLLAGTYQVLVTDSNGCVDSVVATIINPGGPSIIVDSSINVSCNAGIDGEIYTTTTLGSLPYTFLWTNSDITDDITGLTAATYTVTVTDANSCSDVISAVISEPAALVLTPGSVNGTCGLSNGSASVSVSGGTSAYTYLWDDPGAQTSDTASGLTAGTFKVIVTDANDCMDSVSIVLITPGTPTIVIDSSKNVSCNAGNDGEIYTTSSGGTTPYTYLWSNSAITDDITGLVAGTYILTVTDANSCADTVSVTITEPAALVLTPGSVNGTCGLSNGSASVSVSGGTSAYTYLWDDPGAQTSDTASGLTAGTFKVIVTDASGCTDSVSIVLITPGTPTIVIDSSKNVSCNAGNDGKIYTTSSGGTTPYTYLWSNSAITDDITGLVAGTYILTVTDANSCADTVSVIISEPAALGLTPSLDSNVSCNGDIDGGVTITITGGTSTFNYVWSSGNSTLNTAATTNSISGLSAGTYTITVTDFNGCADTDSVAVSEPLAMVLTPDSIDASCGIADGSAIVSVSGGTGPYTYLWNDPGTQTTDTATALLAGAYTVLVTDSNGCVDSVLATVINPSGPSIVADSSKNVSCNAGSDGEIYTTTFGGGLPYTYIWSNSAITDDITSLIAGTYTVTVTDSNSCTDSISVVISEPATLVLTSSTDGNVTCSGNSNGGASINISGGTSPFNYLWSSGDTTLNTTATSNSVVGLAGGTYNITVVDANGCSDTDSVLISEPLPLILISGSTDATCGLSDGSTWVIVAGGITPYTYSWNDPSTQNTDTATALLAGSYTVVVTDSNNCSDSVTAIVNNLGAATITIDSVKNITCSGGNDGEVHISVTGGAAPYTYLWSNSDTIQDITNLIAGNYTVTVTDFGGCAAIADTTLSEPFSFNLSISIVNNILCNGGSSGSVSVNASGGTPPYMYLWNDTGTQTNATATGLMTGTYIVVVTDSSGCVQSDPVLLNEPTALSDTLSSVAANCATNDGQASVTASGGTPAYSYLWDDPLAQTNSTANNLLGGTTYTVIITDSAGCLLSDSVLVNEIPLTASAGTDATLCLGESAPLNANGGTSYAWSPGSGLTDSTIQNPVASPITTTTYIVTVSSGSCTPVMVNVNITINAIPIAFAGNDTTINLGTSVQLMGSGGTIYNWSPSTGLSCTTCQNPLASPEVTTTYIMMISDGNGCSNSDTIILGNRNPKD